MYYYNNELPPQQGWVCPKCGRVNAPWMPTCGCVSSQTSGTSYLVKTSSISQDSHEIAKGEPQTYVINPQEPTNDDKCFECDDFFTCGGQCNKIEDEPQTDCAWK